MGDDTGSDGILERLKALPGVGPVLAGRMEEAIGPSHLSDVLQFANTSGLQTVKGIGASRSEIIREALEETLSEDGSPTTGRVTTSRDRFLAKLRCPRCPDSKLVSQHMSYHCQSCGRNYNEYREIIDFSAESTEPPGLVQTVMESPLYARFYENLMRPVLTRLVSSRSMTEEYALSTRFLDLNRESDLLDVGCGTGNFTRHFVHHMRALEGDDRGLVVGLDLSWPMLERARVYSERDGLQSWIHLVRANATHLPLTENSFSHVHCSGTLHLTGNIQSTVQNFARVLKPGGTLVLGTFLLGRGLLRPLAKRTGELFTQFHWFTRNELYDVLTRTGFEIGNESIEGDAITIKAQRI